MGRMGTVTGGRGAEGRGRGRGAKGAEAGTGEGEGREEVSKGTGGKDFQRRRGGWEAGIPQAACHVFLVAKEISVRGGEGRWMAGGRIGMWGGGRSILEDTLAPPTPLPGHS